MGQPLVDLHWFVFSIGFWEMWAEDAKTSRKLKKQVGGVHEWLGRMLFSFFPCFLGFHVWCVDIGRIQKVSKPMEIGNFCLKLLQK